MTAITRAISAIPLYRLWLKVFGVFRLRAMPAIH
jgi:hypothetical protein